MDDSPSVGRQRSSLNAIHTHGSYYLLLEVKLNFLKKPVTCPRRSLLFRTAYQPLEICHNMKVNCLKKEFMVSTITSNYDLDEYNGSEQK